MKNEKKEEAKLVDGFVIRRTAPHQCNQVSLVVDNAINSTLMSMVVKASNMATQFHLVALESP